VRKAAIIAKAGVGCLPCRNGRGRAARPEVRLTIYPLAHLFLRVLILKWLRAHFAEGRILKGLPDKRSAGHGSSDGGGSFDSRLGVTADHVNVKVKLPVKYLNSLAIVLPVGIVLRAQVHYSISHAKLRLNLSGDVNGLR
jgi:hypothetical protein